MTGASGFLNSGLSEGTGIKGSVIYGGSAPFVGTLFMIPFGEDGTMAAATSKGFGDERIGTFGI